MFWLTVLVISIASTTVLASSILEKPYYELEDAENLFQDFIKQYKRSYNRREYLERLDIFKNTLKDINERNSKYPQTVFAVNHFADMTKEERQQYLGFKPLLNAGEAVTIPDSSTAAPDKLNYTEQGIVSHVKNQASCGSCYIFSAGGVDRDHRFTFTTILNTYNFSLTNCHNILHAYAPVKSNIESQYAMKHNECIALSEGQCLDCLKCGTCLGGIMHEVMEELANTPGIVREIDYKYKPVKWPCKKEKTKNVVAHVKGGKQIKISNETVLKQKLADIGPLAVALNADDFFEYNGGILHPNKCSSAPDHLNHGVLLVGYGEENGTLFWIIKNSWGLKWGEWGYVRLLRGVNACGMGTDYTATADVE